MPRRGRFHSADEVVGMEIKKLLFLPYGSDGVQCLETKERLFSHFAHCSRLQADKKDRGKQHVTPLPPPKKGLRVGASDFPVVASLPCLVALSPFNFHATLWDVRSPAWPFSKPPSLASTRPAGLPSGKIGCKHQAGFLTRQKKRMGLRTV